MGFFAARSNHPGGVNVLMADWQRPICDGQHRPDYLASVGNLSRRRGTRAVLAAGEQAEYPHVILVTDALSQRRWIADTVTGEVTAYRC